MNAIERAATEIRRSFESVMGRGLVAVVTDYARDQSWKNTPAIFPKDLDALAITAACNFTGLTAAMGKGVLREKFFVRGQGLTDNPWDGTLGHRVKEDWRVEFLDLLVDLTQTMCLRAKLHTMVTHPASLFEWAREGLYSDTGPAGAQAVFKRHMNEGSANTLAVSLEHMLLTQRVALHPRTGLERWAQERDEKEEQRRKLREQLDRRNAELAAQAERAAQAAQLTAELNGLLDMVADPVLGSW